MTDIVVLALSAAFFGLCAAYVRWCDHIIGPDGPDVPAAPDAVAAADDLAAAGRP